MGHLTVSLCIIIFLCRITQLRLEFCVTICGFCTLILFLYVIMLRGPYGSNRHCCVGFLAGAALEGVLAVHSHYGGMVFNSESSER